MKIVLVANDRLAESRLQDLYTVDIETQTCAMVSDLPSAVRAVHRASVDLVLLDGIGSIPLCLEVCKVLRAHTYVPVLVAAVTGDDEGTLQAFRTLGVQHFIHVNHDLESSREPVRDPRSLDTWLRLMEARCHLPHTDTKAVALASPSFDMQTTLPGLL